MLKNKKDVYKRQFIRRKNLSDVLLDELDKLNLTVEDLREQSYDNRADMKGIHSGGQVWILEQTQRLLHLMHKP